MVCYDRQMLWNRLLSRHVVIRFGFYICMGFGIWMGISAIVYAFVHAAYPIVSFGLCINWVILALLEIAAITSAVWFSKSTQRSSYFFFFASWGYAISVPILIYFHNFDGGGAIGFPIAFMDASAISTAIGVGSVISATVTGIICAYIGHWSDDYEEIDDNHPIDGSSGNPTDHELVVVS
jgi:hypothetical protein